MNFVLTDMEATELFRTSKRNDDGFLVFHIPEFKLQNEQQGGRLVLVFNSEAKTVSSGKNSIRLSSTQFALLQYVYEHGRTGFEELQDSVWQSNISDNAMRCVITKVNKSLLDNDFSCELISRKSKISLEGVT